MCQGRSLDQLESTATVVSRCVVGYRAAAPQGQGLSALASLAESPPTRIEHRPDIDDEGRLI
jgi:hypothetical protein